MAENDVFKFCLLEAADEVAGFWPLETSAGATVFLCWNFSLIDDSLLWY